MNDLEPTQPSATTEYELPGWAQIPITVLAKIPGVNWAKSVSALCTAATDIGVAYLEGFARQARANTEGRIQVTSALAEQISQRLDVSPEYVNAAMHKFSTKVVGQRKNVEQAVRNAAKELMDVPSRLGAPQDSVGEISDDWLNAFESEAVNMSSQQMQMLFGKILAGEIRAPGSYSIRTVKLMAQLDNKTATLFKKFCSLCVLVEGPHFVKDARVNSLGKEANANSLHPYGLSYSELNLLQEYGLLSPEYRSQMPYSWCVWNGESVLAEAIYLGKPYALIPKNGELPSDSPYVRGPVLTQGGAELYSIVDFEEDPTYTSALHDYWAGLGYEFAPITS